MVIVTPCTAETLSNMARGAGKELLCSLLLATGAPVVVFPAMNVNMLNHPATARNMEILKETGIIIADPETGSLACGYEGKGRLPSVEVILEEMWKTLCPSKKLEGKHVLVTAGPTWEFLDPVSFSAIQHGEDGVCHGEICMVQRRLGNLCPWSCRLFQPQRVCRQVRCVCRGNEADGSGPFRRNGLYRQGGRSGRFPAASFSDRKIKRANADAVTVDLVQNTDIAASLGERKRQGQTLIGFAAESHDLLANASEKMKRKNLDYIVANDITASGSGFGTDTNSVRLLSRDGSADEFSGTKEDVAERVWNRILEEDWLL